MVYIVSLPLQWKHTVKESVYVVVLLYLPATSTYFPMKKKYI